MGNRDLCSSASERHSDALCDLSACRYLMIVSMVSWESLSDMLFKPSEIICSNVGDTGDGVFTVKSLPGTDVSTRLVLVTRVTTVVNVCGCTFQLCYVMYLNYCVRIEAEFPYLEGQCQCVLNINSFSGDPL